MKPFADLLERLLFTQGRNAKVALLRRYFQTAPDPDRGYALAAIGGALDFPGAKAAALRALAETRVDAELLALSYDFVGDLAETIALIWPAREAARPNAPPTLAGVVEVLKESKREEIIPQVERLLDALDASSRIALVKLLTGGLRVGASLRLAKIALAEIAGEGIAADDIEEVWHGLDAPYEPLFAWIEGRGPRPDPEAAPVFRPPMLAHPLEARDMESLHWADFAAEWKWDGIRVQLVSTPGGARLYSRGADDISRGFPELLEGIGFHAVLDGELLVIRGGTVAPFADLQQRLNRKRVGAKMMGEFPVAIRLYDILFDGAADLRALPFAARRHHLEAWFERVRPPRMDLSPLISFAAGADLAGLRAGARDAAIEGLMLKRLDAPYLPGRPKGLWWKWKRDPLSVDAVLMYAQRGHGKRSSFYSDYTFGVWADEDTLVPIGKAYSGYTDAELVRLDRWIRNHTTARFGPVREVEKEIVLEVGFDSAQLSARHKSGVALRFPRVLRIREDKPAAEADNLETVKQFISRI